MRAAVSAALFLFLGVACGGHGGGPGSGGLRSTAPAQTCQSVHFPFPPPAAALTARDEGRTVGVHVGDLVQVTLLGKDAPGGRWPQLTASGDALLVLANPANTTTVGTRLGEYCAVKAGTATISSPPWSVTVEVR